MWLNYVIPFLTILLTYSLGYFSNITKKKDDIDIKRYETFYIPFMRKIMRLSYSNTNHGDLPQHIRKEFTFLIMDNIQYLGKESSKCVAEYYSVSVDILTKEHTADYTNAKRYLDISYSRLEKAILKEAEALSKSLKYPNLAKVVLDDINLRSLK